MAEVDSKYLSEEGLSIYDALIKHYVSLQHPKISPDQIDELSIVNSINGKTGAVTLNLSDFEEDSTYKLVTEAEKTAWNNKLSLQNITISSTDLGENQPLADGHFYLVYEE